MSSNRTGGLAPMVQYLAIKSEAGWTPERRLAMAVHSATGGNTPYVEYFAAGRRAVSRGISMDAIEDATREWMRSVFHPVYTYLLELGDRRAVVAGMVAYNNRDLGGEWQAESARFASEFGGAVSSQDYSSPPYWQLHLRDSDLQLVANRYCPDGFEDPLACQATSLALINYVVDESRLTQGAEDQRCLSSAAVDLGAERSAIAEVAGLFESDRTMRADAVARRIGVGRRTLERELGAAGVSIGRVRLATMVIGAASQMVSGASLTTIAVDNGFSDLAHMSRTFKAFGGLSPNSLRKATRHPNGDLGHQKTY